MYYLIYLSTSVDYLTEKDIENILARSRNINEENRITGLLVYYHKSFIQMLEGSEEDVNETYGRIKEDQRHFRVTKMFSGPSERRYFPGWKMAYEPVDSKLAKKIIAFEPLDSGRTFIEKNIKEHFALEMIHYFCEVKMNK